MLFAEHPAQVQPQAKVVLPLRGVLFAPVVGFGGPFQRLGRKARPVVGDRQAQAALRELRPGPHHLLGVATRVGEQVLKHLEQQLAVQKQGPFPLGGELEAALSPQDGAGFRQLAAQVGKPRFRPVGVQVLQPLQGVHALHIALQAHQAALHGQDGVHRLFRGQVPGGQRV